MDYTRTDPQNLERPSRRPNRLPGYDYSQNGAYFVTMCTKGRRMLFGDVGADSISARVVAQTFSEVIAAAPYYTCPCFVVMPNHFHALLVIDRADMESAPTISDLMRDFKRYSTLEYGKLVRQGAAEPYQGRLWQRSFHDHIIRNDREYRLIGEYIITNPARWREDCFYPSVLRPVQEGRTL